MQQWVGASEEVWPRSRERSARATESSYRALFRSDGLMMALGTRLPLEADGTGVRADFTMREGQRTAFVFEGVKSVDGRASWPMDQKEHERAFHDTVKFWRDWLGSSTYHGRWREMVHRSALTLKLLTFEPTGAIVRRPPRRRASRSESVATETGITVIPGFETRLSLCPRSSGLGLPRRLAPS